MGTWWDRARLTGLAASVLLIATTLPPAPVGAQQGSEPTGDDGGGIASAPPGWEQQGAGNSYVLLDSHDAGGPQFNVPAHTPTTDSGVDSGGITQVPLGFTFEFYGSSYTEVYIVAHGYLSFGEQLSMQAQAGPLSVNDEMAVPAVLGYWANFNLGLCGTVHYDTYGAAPNRVFVAEWRQVCHGLPNRSFDPVTFQIKLFENTDQIEFHYFDLDAGSSVIDYGASALSGIRRGPVPGEYYLQYSWFQPALEDNFAIRLWPVSCDGLAANFVGTRADDDLDPFLSSHVVYGHTGDDTITGTANKDVLCGAEGDDVIRGLAGEDVLDGGPGHDTIRGGPGIDGIDGRSGNDKLFGGGGNDAIQGGDGADLINGQGGSDFLLGEAGHDTINGQGAADTIYGGDGVLTAGSGNDTINGQRGSDLLQGEDGHDTIRGSTGPDTIIGDSGNDELFGGEGNDELFGGEGNDKCAGNTGAGDRAQAATCETTPGVEVLF